MKNILTRIKIYLPAIALFLLFNIFHFIQKGWIGFHKESPWAESFEPVDFIGFIYNIGILFWRLFDFGRIGVWIVFLVILFKFRNSILGRKEINFLFFIFISLFFILPLNMLWAKNLLGHRYLLPLFVIFSIFCAKLLFDLNFSKKIKVVLLSIWFTVIISGHFWIYPIGISQGWDSTTAHLPYYDLRKQAILYLEKNKIDFSEVKTFFPNTASIDVIELNNDDRNFDTYDSKCKYVFYSNIYNISDEVMKDLHFNFKTLQVFEKNRIFVKILVRI